MKPEIYIDGQPLESIGELRMEYGNTYATGGVLPRMAKFGGMIDAPELVLPMNIEPEQLMEIISESTKKAIEAFKALVKATKEAEKQLVLWGTIDTDFWAEERATNPRCYRLSWYARKARTRKKNQHRLEREWKRREKKAAVR